jgi:glucoamylase
MDLLHSPFLTSLPPSSIFNITAIPHSIMHSLASLLLIGSFALQSVFAVPNRVVRDEVVKRSVDTFIATESPIALRNLLCNIGSAGSCAAGASSGIVIASPDKTNPNCVFHSESFPNSICAQLLMN